MFCKIYIKYSIKSIQHKNIQQHLYDILKDVTLNVINFTALSSMRTLLNKMHKRALKKQNDKIVMVYWL